MWTDISCAVFSRMNRQKRYQIDWLTTMKKLINQSGSFENTAKCIWQLMELFKNGKCPGVSIAVSSILASVF